MYIYIDICIYIYIDICIYIYRYMDTIYLYDVLVGTVSPNGGPLLGVVVVAVVIVRLRITIEMGTEKHIHTVARVMMVMMV